MVVSHSSTLDRRMTCHKRPYDDSASTAGSAMGGGEGLRVLVRDRVLGPPSISNSRSPEKNERTDKEENVRGRKKKNRAPSWSVRCLFVLTRRDVLSARTPGMDVPRGRESCGVC